MALTADQIYKLNHMDKVPFDCSLGTAIGNLEATGVGGALATGSTLIGVAGVSAPLDVKGNAKIIVGNGTTATSVSVSGDATITNAGVVTVSKVNNKTCYSGLSVSETDSDATVTITVAGLVAADVAVCTLKAAANAVYVTKAVCGTDSIVVTLSGNGGAGTVVSYIAFKA